MLARDQSTQMTNFGDDRNESCNLLARCSQCRELVQDFPFPRIHNYDEAVSSVGIKAPVQAHVTCVGGIPVW